MPRRKSRIRTGIAIPIQPIDQFDLQIRAMSQGLLLKTDTVYVWCHSGHAFNLEFHAMGDKASYLFKQLESPHEFHGSIPYLARLASKWHSVDLGILATDLIRRPAVTLAQDINTIAHFTPRQIRVFVGSGEVMSNGPGGKPVAFLEQELPTLAHHLHGPKQSKDQKLMHLRAPDGRKPLLGIAGRMPKMQALAGQYAGAICPVMNDLKPAEYRGLVENVQQAAKDHKRDIEMMEYGGQFYFIFANSQKEKDSLLSHPLIKYNALLLSAETWRNYTNVEHPFGPKFQGYVYFDPENLPCSIEQALGQVPDGLIEQIFMVGTVDEIFAKLVPYFEAGLTEVVSQTPAALISQPEGIKQLRQLRKLHAKIKRY